MFTPENFKEAWSSLFEVDSTTLGEGEMHMTNEILRCGHNGMELVLVSWYPKLNPNYQNVKKSSRYNED